MLKQIIAALSSRERTTFRLGAAIAAICIVVLATLWYRQSTHFAPTGGGEYVEGNIGQPVAVNPVVADSDVDRSLTRLVFADLDQLAEKIEVSSEKGRTVWRVRLRENMLWQDGQKITSDDIIFTVNQIQNPVFASPLRAGWLNVAAARLSELELQFSLAAPYAYFENILRDLRPIPKHIFYGIPADNWRLSDYLLQPIGSGWYEFDSYDRRSDGFITSYRVKKARITNVPAPKIDSIKFYLFANSENLLAAWNSGRIDGWVLGNPADLKQSRRPYDIYRFRLPIYEAVFFNPIHNPALKESPVREALTLAVDRSSVITQAAGGFGLPTDGPIPADPETSASSSITGTDLVRANQILDYAGWTRDAVTGLRKKRLSANQDTVLEITLTTPRALMPNRAAEAVAESWKKIGVKVSIKALAENEISGQIIPLRDYDALVFGNTVGPDLDLSSFWRSTERFAPGSNLSLYGDPTTDDLLEEIRAETDASSRSKKISEVAKRIQKAYPAVFLFTPETVLITSRSLQGVVPKTIEDASVRFDQMDIWYVRTHRVFN